MHPPPGKILGTPLVLTIQNDLIPPVHEFFSSFQKLDFASTLQGEEKDCDI